ncbi:MAG TPA: HD-GYP domain-containing protein [Symbiobacteriaceae bacterium]|nr:HD-GYP domain-containing protein [Symbiobacteriaceae bacterium]
MQPQAGAGPARLLLQKLVLWLVILLGSTFLGVGAVQLHTQPPELILVLAVLAVLAELAKVQVYETDDHSHQAISISFGTAVNMAAVGIAGFIPAVVTAFVGAIAYQVLVGRKKLPWQKRLFNLFNPVACSAVAAMLFRVLGGSGTNVTPRQLLAGIVAALIYYLANAGVITLMISLQSVRPVLAVWKESVWFAPAYILLGLIGMYLGAAFHAVGLIGALLFSVPVLVLRYTFTLYARKSQSSIQALRRAKQDVENANARQERTLEQLIIMISSIIDARDNSTYGHSRQVASYAVAIGQLMGMSPDEVAQLRTAALLHDLGKVGVPEAILKKPARLTPEEYATIKEHAALGERILAQVEELAPVARIVGEHHERYDGTGYPEARTGEAITLAGRIVAVADTLDSILSDRPYSKARSLEAALAELERCAGSHFDPRVVAAVHQLAETIGPGAFVNSAAAGQQ